MKIGDKVLVIPTGGVGHIIDMGTDNFGKWYRTDIDGVREEHELKLIGLRSKPKILNRVGTHLKKQNMKEVQAVSPTVAMGKILSSNKGLFFSVKFVKTDGSIRKMNCRKGVEKGLSGKGAKYNAVERGLLAVYDVQKGGYRTLNFNTLISFKMQGQSFRVNKEYSLPF